MNELFVNLGIEAWKPLLAALALPPVPLLLLVVVAARVIAWRRAFGWMLLLLALAGLWLSACAAAGERLQQRWLAAPALSAQRIADLKSQPGGLVVVILGGGHEVLAPEYGSPSLSAYSLERLRYGIWLSRAIDAPMLFSGGLGHAATQGMPEAQVAAEIAAREFQRPLRWRETASRDTRENARRSLPLLQDASVKRIVLVTHGWHMARALRAFDEEAARRGVSIESIAAPVGLAPRIEHPVLRWMPSAEGFMLVRAVLREQIAWALGA